MENSLNKQTTSSQGCAEEENLLQLNIMLAKYGTSAYAGCEVFNAIYNQHLKCYALTIDMAQ
ncbi:hypothetical protein [Flavobacterium sp. W22_SRS_FP1]|uniref:hypothetical protein n=1 Tax=Flavobacterium sp. W22_SRS_FP1 TaxID=3240276 RepID=UPI003F90B723